MPAIFDFAKRDKFEELRLFLDRRHRHDLGLTDPVARIIADVKTHGDKALIKYASRFDSEDISPDQLRVSSDEFAHALRIIDPGQKKALELACKRIHSYHVRQLPEDESWVDDEGVQLGWRWNPIQACGLYVPGGTAALASSVLMMGVPAKVAQVRDIALAVPPRQALNPLILYAAGLIGVSTIYRMGGAQAVAALAYGTETVQVVDKIVGPGNAYVSEAKRQVFGDVGIDMIAGPSEVVVVWDGHAKIQWVAADLIAQAEHDPLAQAILITTDRDKGLLVDQEVRRQLKEQPRADIIARSWQDTGCIVLVQSVEKAMQVANFIAPEHLELATADPECLLPLVNNAGSVFLGEDTPEAMGDYVAGPNHVLPTGGSVRFFSGLSVLDFVKRTSVVRTSREALAKLGPSAIELAKSEQLAGHARSIQVRLESRRTKAR